MVPFHRFYQHGFIPEGLQRVAGGRSAAETAGSMKQKYSASRRARRDARQLLSESVCRRSNISGTPSGVQKECNGIVIRRSPRCCDLRLPSVIPPGYTELGVLEQERIPQVRFGALCKAVARTRGEFCNSNT